MTTDHFESLARLTPALHDTDCDFCAHGSHRAVRAEAVRQLHWLLRAWARTRSTQTPGAPGSIGPTVRARRTDGTDVHRQMGEDVPSWFDEGGSRVRIVEVARGTASERLADQRAESPWVHARQSAYAAGAGDDAGARERP
jgi:hypothetical protein